MAETEGNRVNLAAVDLSHHRYPFDLLFKGSLDRIGFFKRLFEVVPRTVRSDAALTLLTSYEKPEVWVQLLLLRLKGRRAVIFCNSTIYDQPQRFLRGVLKSIIFRSVDAIFCYGARSRDYALHYRAEQERIFFRCQAAALPMDYSPRRLWPCGCELRRRRKRRASSMWGGFRQKRGWIRFLMPLPVYGNRTGVRRSCWSVLVSPARFWSTRHRHSVLRRPCTLPAVKMVLPFSTNMPPQQRWYSPYQ